MMEAGTDRYDNKKAQWSKTRMGTVTVIRSHDGNYTCGLKDA